MEYLFHGNDPVHKDELLRVIEEGFLQASEYLSATGHEAVVLSNSLALPAANPRSITRLSPSPIASTDAAARANPNIAIAMRRQ